MCNSSSPWDRNIQYSQFLCMPSICEEITIKLTLLIFSQKYMGSLNKFQDCFALVASFLHLWSEMLYRRLLLSSSTTVVSEGECFKLPPWFLSCCFSNDISMFVFFRLPVLQLMHSSMTPFFRNEFLLKTDTLFFHILFFFLEVG